MGLKQGVKANWVAWLSEPLVKKHGGLADLHNGGMQEESMDLHMIMRDKLESTQQLLELLFRKGPTDEGESISSLFFG